MIFFFPLSHSQKDKKQSRLLQAAALFLLFYSIILTLSSAVRFQSWNTNYPWLHWVGFFVWWVCFAFLHYQTSRRLPEGEAYLLPIAALLCGWGLLTIWRLDETYGWRQTLWLIVCTVVFWVGLILPRFLHFLRRFKYLWLLGGLLLTSLTFIMGVYPGGVGPQLWLGCCGFYIQPSEPLKLLLIVYMAAYLADRLGLSSNLLASLMPTFVLFMIALVILVIQRDLGTATIFILLYTVITFLASGKYKTLLISALTILLAAFIGYQLFDLIRIRIDGWIDPWIYSSGRSYQIVQSLLAVASGGLFGRGPGLGSPSLVPVSHSDFIFAAIAEETGLLGTTGIILLFCIMVTRGFQIALKASNQYHRYLAAGLTVYLGIQSVFIIGGNLRLLPLTGVTLPFVSYGGSSLLTSFVSILVLSLISHQSEEEPAVLVSSTPYLLISSSLIVGLLAVSLTNGWWAYVRSGDLTGRQDNARRIISDRYSRRGSVLDRNNLPLAVTVGNQGEYQRQLIYVPVVHVIGYTHIIYGQTGLEASLDSYLQGLQGNSASTIWLYHLINAQNPPGLDIRLTLDLQLQQLADELLKDHIGSLVLLNAQNGEILAMASHPYFDANQLNQYSLAEWKKDERSPMLNRAVQGQYPLGTSLAPFLWAVANPSQFPLPDKLNYQRDGKELMCALPLPSTPSWSDAVTNGCPGAIMALAKQIPPQTFAQLYEALGFLITPEIPLPAASPSKIMDPHLETLALGQVENFYVSPLQMAIAAATLTTNGSRPSPSILLSVLTPHQGWVVLPPTPSQEVPALQTSIAPLAATSLPIWESLGKAQTKDHPITWYIAGTINSHQDKQQAMSFALALVLEEDQPALAQKIGRQMLQGHTPTNTP